MPPRSSTALVVWRQNRGRNGWDSPTRLLPGQVAEAMNVTLERGTLGRKRNGSVPVEISGSYDGVYQLHRHVPGQNEEAAEIFMATVDPPNTTYQIQRVAGGTTAVILTNTDTIDVTTDPGESLEHISFVTGNGKCFIFMNSDVNRGHVFDPATSTTEIRRMGLAAPGPGALSVFNQGSGSYPAVLRYYRIQWVRQVSGATYLLSNLGAAVAFTPSGTGANASVYASTAGADPGITHFIVWVSTDDLQYYQLSEALLLAASPYVDTTLAADYPQGELAPEEGAYTPFPSCKFGLWTGDRLIGLGVWETAAGDSHVPKNGTVYFSPVLDTSGSHYADDERCSNSITFKGTITISRDSGAEDRALAGPLYDEILCFQSRGVFALTPTGQAQKPFVRSVISPVLGAVSQTSTFLGEDEFGRPVIYFLDPTRGPYRFGPRGMQYLGYDVQDIWHTFVTGSTVGIGSVIGPHGAHGVYDVERRVVIWELATTNNYYMTERLVFAVREGVETPDGVRYGWTRETLTGKHSALGMLPTTIGATMNRSVSPYSGQAWQEADSTRLLKHAAAGVTADHGTAYQGTITSPVFDAGAPQYVKSITHAQGFVTAKATAGAEVQVAITQNHGDRPPRTHQVSLAPRAVGQTRITARLDGIEAQDVSVFQVTLGDRAAVATPPWTIDEVGVEVELTDQLVRNP